MEFGLFAQLFVPNYERDVDPMAEHKRIMRNVEVGVAADRTGIKYVWCPEHHFLDEYSHMPGPEVYLSYIAAQTERVHVGSAIFNITPKVNHPARVAETVALLDHVTEGRFEFGTGRGSSTTEVYGFDIDDLDETSAMWDETHPRDPEDVEAGPVLLRGQVLPHARARGLPEALRQQPPGHVGRGREPPDVRQGRRDGPRRVLLHPRHARQDRAADPGLQGRRGQRRRRSATTSTTTSWSSPT